MPRPAQFERDEALQAAVQVFWRQGYAGTSMKDLVEATHLQPGSLYGAFQSKRALFVEALDTYFAGTRRFVAKTLDSGDPPLDRLRTFFHTLVQQSVSDPDAKGCLLVNTLLEAPADDPEITRRVAGMFAEVEQRLRGVIAEAQARGEVDPGKDPDALARLLVTGIYGLRVYNKTRPSRETLQGIVDALLAGIAPAGAGTVPSDQ